MQKKTALFAGVALALASPMVWADVMKVEFSATVESIQVQNNRVELLSNLIKKATN